MLNEAIRSVLDDTSTAERISTLREHVKIDDAWLDSHRQTRSTRSSAGDRTTEDS